MTSRHASQPLRCISSSDNQRFRPHIKETMQIVTNGTKINRLPPKTRPYVAIFMTGPPGAGKTTQVELIKQRFGVDHTVESFVGKHLRADATKLGISDKILQEYTDCNDSRLPLATQLNKKRGLGSSHYLTQRLDLLIRSDISTKKDTPIIWVYSRGPSSAEQAKYLHSVLGIKPDLFLVLQLEQQQKLLDRVSYRRVDPVTNITYNIMDNPPTDPNILARLEVRDSDMYKTNLETRYMTWKTRTMPVIDYYSSLNDPNVRIEYVTADRSREQVFSEIESLISMTLHRKQIQYLTQVRVERPVSFSPYSCPEWLDHGESSSSSSPSSDSSLSSPEISNSPLMKDDDILMDAVANHRFVAVRSQ
jgi:adenylate kinase family enzyme